MDLFFGSFVYLVEYFAPFALTWIIGIKVVRILIRWVTGGKVC